MKELINATSTELSESYLVFVTYCWESSECQSKIRSLTFELRQAGENAEMHQLELQKETALQFQAMMLRKFKQAKKVIVVLSEGYKRKAENEEGGVFFEYKIILAEIDQNPSKYIFANFDNYSDKIVPIGFAKRFVMSLKNESDFHQILRKSQGVDEFHFGEVASTKPAILPEKIQPLFTKSEVPSETTADMRPNSLLTK